VNLFPGQNAPKLAIGHTRREKGMLKKFALTFIDPCLSTKGFRRKKLSWNRPASELTHVVGIQPSRWNSTERVEFTINIGTWHPAVWRICWGETGPDFITTDECFPAVRVGKLVENLSAKARDLWWTIDPQTNSQELSSVVLEILCDACLTFLDQFQNLEDIHRFLSNAPSSFIQMPVDKIYYAIVCGLCGETQRSRKLLEEFEINAEDPWHDRVVGVKARLVDKIGTSE
jgi:hypothetical protein